jgi:Carboxypeptidase regulatory-like domain
MVPRAHVWFVVLLLSAVSLFAQGDRGTIAGLVTDASGGVIPGGTIEAVQQGTNLRAETVTTTTGVYRLLALPIGKYTVTATVPGFQTHVLQDVQVQVNQTTTIDIALTVGQVAETVTITGAAPLIQTESADVGLVVESKRFLDLPLTLGGGIRNPSSFIKLSPGTRAARGPSRSAAAGPSPI